MVNTIPHTHERELLIQVHAVRLYLHSRFERIGAMERCTCVRRLPEQVQKPLPEANLRELGLSSDRNQKRIEMQRRFLILK
jgi:hypothetical protein